MDVEMWFLVADPPQKKNQEMKDDKRTVYSVKRRMNGFYNYVWILQCNLRLSVRILFSIIFSYIGRKKSCLKCLC